MKISRRRYFKPPLSPRPSTVLFLQVLTSGSQIIPRAIDFFTGKALRYEMEDEDYTDEEDDEDEDDLEGLDDDDDVSSPYFLRPL